MSWVEICNELHMAGQVCANAKVPSVSFIRRFSPTLQYNCAVVVVIMIRDATQLTERVRSCRQVEYKKAHVPDSV